MTAAFPHDDAMMAPAAVVRVTIVQGEAKASASPQVEMSTILGSCVATCLFDPVARVGGMNHFLLAEPPSHVRNQAFDSDYGLFLMELLINEMLGLGAHKKRMRARLYGGANLNPDLSPIGTANAAFARLFLRREAIPCVFEDLEGTRSAHSVSTGQRAGPRPAGASRNRTYAKTSGATAIGACDGRAILTQMEHIMAASNSAFIRVLTVDDSASMRALLRGALTSRGFNVEQCEDGQEALEWLASNEVDVIITDINMPRLDGFGLIEKLRTSALHAERPILVLTTESSDEKKQRARNAGATGWIVKPFDVEKLTAALRRVIH